MFDLYVGYDERLIAESSRDLTTFQTPFGALRLRTLPMGWCNAVPIFHDDVTYILQPEIPDLTVPYIDDCPGKGPESDYRDRDGNYETIPQNPGIRRFVWEHFNNMNRIVQRIKYAGGTFSGTKSIICAREIMVVGHRCTPEGRLPDESRVAVIKNWGPCKDLSEVRAFLGTVGVARIFIRNFAHRAHPLVHLTRKGVPFEFGEEQIKAQEDLKQALLESPALRPLNYQSSAPVILAVDTSFIAVGYHLCQCDEEDPRRRYYSRFGSITLNDRESRFSQPKLEIYGLYRALRALKIYLIGVRRLLVEVDARYIKGMLQNPVLAPSASINRWIVTILTYHFELVHVPGSSHAPDGLSRRYPQPGDAEQEDDDFEDWIDKLHGFLHQILPVRTAAARARPPVQLLALATGDSRDFSEGEEPAATNVDAIGNESRESQTESHDTPDAGVKLPMSDIALKVEERLHEVAKWLRTLARPPGLTDAAYTAFIKYCTQFFVDGDRLWKKDPKGAHKLVVFAPKRLAILRQAHDDVGHRGRFATQQLIAERFWWPFLREDVAWYVRTCHLCQVRQTRQVLIPPKVAIPAPLFVKIYVDSMYLPVSGGYRIVVQARCSVCHFPEWRMLRRETDKTIGDWIYQDLLCRWGALVEIVTDNGAPFVKALRYLEKKYKVHHICISGYNSRANGIIERPHFDVRQALFKAADGNETRWSQVAHSVFWSERVTIRKRMGCSPYFAVTGCHPVLPFDVTEATYLQPAPTSILSTTDLIARRAIALQRRQEQLAQLHEQVYQARVQAARKFERDHAATICDFDFSPGDLVLMRHTQIEKSLNRKMRPRYTGPLIVVARNRGGAYIICELDGTVFHRPIAAFRLLPYLACKSIPLPENFIDISQSRLEELMSSDDDGTDDIEAEVAGEPDIEDDTADLPQE